MPTPAITTCSMRSPEMCDWLIPDYHIPGWPRDESADDLTEVTGSVDQPRGSSATRTGAGRQGRQAAGGARCDRPAVRRVGRRLHLRAGLGEARALAGRAHARRDHRARSGWSHSPDEELPARRAPGGHPAGEAARSARDAHRLLRLPPNGDRTVGVAPGLRRRGEAGRRARRFARLPRRADHQGGGRRAVTALMAPSGAVAARDELRRELDDFIASAPTVDDEVPLEEHFRQLVEYQKALHAAG